jgi:hypothetical protein
MPIYLKKWKLAASLLLRLDVRFVRISVLSPLPRRSGTGELCAPPPTDRPETLHQAATLAADRCLWDVLSRVWKDWRSALDIVQPTMVIAGHMKGFRLFRTWKLRRGKRGRLAVAREVRDLIRRMSGQNPFWGAPHIHGELLKLGITIGETSVAKYMVRHRKPPSQTWRTFLDNHLKTWSRSTFSPCPQSASR